MAGKKALLVVDVQNDFLPGGALGIAGGDQVVPVLNEYIRRFREAGLPIIFTRDWHPAITKHFKSEGGPWPPHCVEGTPGAAFAPGLEIPPHAIVVSKGMDPNEDSYSAFHAKGPESESFETLLRRLGVTHLYIGGLATDYCVRYSARDAARLGFPFTALEDAVRGVSDEDSRRALEEMARAGEEMITLAGLSVEKLKEPPGRA